MADTTNYRLGEEKVLLSEVSERVTLKNKDKYIDRTLTISAADGMVDQKDYYGRKISSENTENYYVISNGEFAYNKSYSSGYPFGAIKRLDRYDNGILSPLYICFKLDSERIDSDYFVQFCESNKWNRYINSVCTEGARNHGILNVAVGDFFNIPIKYLPLDKQKLIGKFLCNIDMQISNYTKQKELLEQKKKHYLNVIFNDKNEDNYRFGGTKEYKLKELITFYNGLTGKTKKDFEGNELNSKYIQFKNIHSKYINFSELGDVYVEQNENQNRVKSNDILVTGSSENIEEVGTTNIFLHDINNVYLNSFSYIMRSNELVNPLYLHYNLKSNRTRKKIMLLGQGITRINLSPNRLSEIKLGIHNINVQGQIANLLYVLDRQIEDYTKQKELLEQKKKHYLNVIFNDKIK